MKKTLLLLTILLALGAQADLRGGESDHVGREEEHEKYGIHEEHEESGVTAIPSGTMRAESSWWSYPSDVMVEAAEDVTGIFD